jgi:hypothetical protein
MRGLFTGSDERPRSSMRSGATGPEVWRCVGPAFGSKEVELRAIAMELVPEAAEAAYVDLPAVIVWDLSAQS